jgi:tryptophan 2,3-dioxygenase
MRKLNTLFQCNSALFRILTSMPRETFALFRAYTDGASAIQSEQYKLIEALAARPSPSRLYSAAFASVPGVKKIYEQGKLLHFEDLLPSYADWENADFLELIQSMVQFDASFVQWKKVHTNIAVKVLGSQSGTGYTQGTPYLKANADARLFPFLQQWVGRLL